MERLLLRGCLLAFVASATTVYVDSESTAKAADGSLSFPLRSLSSALQIPDEDLNITLLPSSQPATYILSAQPSARYLHLHCSNHTLMSSLFLVVVPGAVLSLRDCRLSSALASRDWPLVAVYGTMALQGVQVWGLRMKGFVAYGELKIAQSQFWDNADTIIAANSLGWKIHVSDSLFANNTSVVGAVFVLNPSIGPQNSSELLVENCVFNGNSASAGGSVLLFMEGQRPSASPPPLNSVAFAACSFDGNSGYLFLVYLNGFSVSISDCEFHRHEYVLVLMATGGSVAITDSVSQQSKGFFMSTQLLCDVTIRNVTVTDTVAGPVLLCLNRYSLAGGFMEIRNLTIVNPALENLFYRSSTLFLVATSAVVDGLTVIGGSSCYAIAGTYSDGAFEVRHVSVRGATVWAAGLLALFHASGAVHDVEAHNSTLLTISWLSLHLSQARVSNLRIANVHTDFKTVGKFAYTVITLFNSEGNFSYITADLPNALSTPVLYCDISTILLTNVTVPQLSGVLLAAYHDSIAVLRNVAIGRADTAIVFDVNMNSRAQLKGIAIESGQVANTFMNVQQSTVSLEDVSLSDTSFQFFVSSVHSHCSISSISFSNVYAEVLFPRQISR